MMMMMMMIYLCVCVYTHVFNSVLFRFRRRLSLSAGGIRRLNERSPGPRYNIIAFHAAPQQNKRSTFYRRNSADRDVVVFRGLEKTQWARYNNDDNTSRNNNDNHNNNIINNTNSI